jgi:hypothetical protein
MLSGFIVVYTVYEEIMCLPNCYLNLYIQMETLEMKSGPATVLHIFVTHAAMFKYFQRRGGVDL